MKTFCLHFGITRSTAILLFLLAISGSIGAQNFFGFKEILTGPSFDKPPYGNNVTPSLLEANTSGGTMEASLQFKKSSTEFCPAKFRFEWRFLQPIEVLKKGDEVAVEIKSTLLTAACYNSKGIISVSGSNNGSLQVRNKNLKTAADLGAIDVKFLEALPVSNTHITKVKVYYVTSQYTFFKLDIKTQGPVGSEILRYEVVYVYEKGLQQTANCDPDISCHNLYSIGVNIGMAEYAALKNEPTDFVAALIDGAIGHAKASKCVPTAQLEEINRWLKTAEESQLFYNDIVQERVRLAEYVEEHCNCCPGH